MSEQPLKVQIKDAMKEAMLARDKERLAAIRLIQAEFKRVEVDERIELDDSRVLTILDKMVKQRRDSEKQYRDAGRNDLADREKFEIDVIQQFLPAALSDAELVELIERAIAASGATNMRDMGKVMGILKPQVQGRCDMAAVGQKIKARLS